jgi:hypothetical protein
MLPGFVDVVASTHAIGSWHTGALASAANQYAAMPSLHIAWAVWCTVVVWCISSRTWSRALAVLYPFLTAFAVLSTGNHFVLDVLGGLVTIAVSLLIVRFMGGQLPRLRTGVLRRSPRQVGSKPAYRMSQTCYEVRDQVD